MQFPFAIPFLLFKIEVLVPHRYKYKIGLYLDIVEEDASDDGLEVEDFERLSKVEIYALVLVRNYIRAVLRLYKSIETDMKKRCEELEYKKRMRQLKKNNSQKESSTSTAKPTKRFTF